MQRIAIPDTVKIGLFCLGVWLMGLNEKNANLIKFFSGATTQP
jgi:hypothetical protein